MQPTPEKPEVLKGTATAIAPPLSRIFRGTRDLANPRALSYFFLQEEDLLEFTLAGRRSDRLWQRGYKQSGNATAIQSDPPRPFGDGLPSAGGRRVSAPGVQTDQRGESGPECGQRRVDASRNAPAAQCFHQSQHDPHLHFQRIPDGEARLLQVPLTTLDPTGGGQSPPPWRTEAVHTMFNATRRHRAIGQGTSHPRRAQQNGEFDQGIDIQAPPSMLAVGEIGTPGIRVQSPCCNSIGNPVDQLPLANTPPRFGGSRPPPAQVDARQTGIGPVGAERERGGIGKEIVQMRGQEARGDRGCSRGRDPGDAPGFQNLRMATQRQVLRQLVGEVHQCAPLPQTGMPQSLQRRQVQTTRLDNELHPLELSADLLLVPQIECTMP